MAQVGGLLLIVALLTGLGATVFYAFGFTNDNKSINKLGNYLQTAQIVAVTISIIVLTYAFATDYFMIKYVAQYSSLKLPLIYKISAVWAGQAGSLLFWGWLVAVFAAVELFRIRKFDTIYKNAVFFTTSLTTTFFVMLAAFFTRVFEGLNFMPMDGTGMNPLLQNPGMIYHPPTLYIGFVGFTIVLGHAMAALIKKDVSSFWIKASRKWSIFTWIFLTVGIVLGGQWAYVELGWGGYWAWDPVENASLLPWFTATAFIHSAIMYERKNKLKGWAFILIYVSYILCIFGTFLTRSGVMDSVHSFGKSNLGVPFALYMIIASVAYVVFFLMRAKLTQEKDDEEFNFLSREGLFFISNWLFVGLMLVVLLGTIMPMISELFGHKKTVGIPYYNKVSMPFFGLILLASGIAPLISYKKAQAKDFTKKFLPSLIAMIIVMAAMFAMGYTKMAPLILTGFATFSLATIISQILTAVASSGVGVLYSRRRFYGGLVVHIGVVLLAYGVIASAFYNTQKEKVLSPGETMKFRNYQLTVGDIMHKEKGNYVTVYTPVKVVKNGKHIVTLGPERRFYEKRPEDNFAEVAIRTTFAGDLYIILASYSKPENYIGLQVIYQPFIAWIWIGCLVMVLGGFYAISSREEYA